MSCHTWFYKRVDMSYEEAREMVLKSMEEMVDWLEGPEYTKMLAEALEEDPYDTYISSMSDCLPVFKRQLRMIKAGLCKEAVMNKVPDHEYINGKMYTGVEEYGNIFRVYDYPEDILWSYEDCMLFIENRRLIEGTRVDMRHPNWQEELKKFWQEYPDGFIRFG